MATEHPKGSWSESASDKKSLLFRQICTVTKRSPNILSENLEERFTLTMSDELRLGLRIRELRLKNKLTLHEVANRTGFTKSYVSMLENGKKLPPIATLSKIAHAFAVDITYFFKKRDDSGHILLVRAEKREIVVRNGTNFGYQYESIAPTIWQKKMEPFIITFPQKSKVKPKFNHDGEEFLYVLKGEVRFLYGDNEYFLNEGDGIYFDASINHRGEWSGGKIAQALVVII